MAGKDILIMSRKEARRLYVLRKVLDGEIKQVDAAGILSMSTRQVRRIVERIRDKGADFQFHHHVAYLLLLIVAMAGMLINPKAAAFTAGAASFLGASGFFTEAFFAAAR